MSHRITTDDVAHVARLARLNLDDSQLQAATEELGAMLDHFAEIDSLDLDDVAPMPYPYPLTNVMRDDELAASLSRNEVLDAAPLAQDGQFRVPPIGGVQ